MTELPVGEVALRLAVAAALGAGLGFNREVHRKPAGLRTLAMVALGAALAGIGAVATYGNSGDSAARVSQGVLTGIGFIGAGVIMRREAAGAVTGLTTASAIWVVAGLGYAAGLGQWRLALLGGGVALFILVAGGILEEKIRPWVERHDAE